MPKVKADAGVPALTYDIASVVWEDSCFFQRKFENGADLPHKPITMFTTGLLVKRDKQGVSLAQEVSEEGALRHVTYIPAVCVKAITVHGKAKVRHTASSVVFFE